MCMYSSVSRYSRTSWPSQSLNRSAVFILALAMAATVLGFAEPLRAATATFDTSAPTLGPSDVSQLTSAADRTNNVGGDVNDQGGNFVYIDNGRPAQGQTFTTGGNANGYALTAVTLKQVAYATYGFVPDITYHIRITSPSGNSLTVLAEETAFVPEATNDCATCNFPNFGPSGFLPGSGRYVTFTFANPAVLSPNTTYGFDLGGTSVGDHYWETDGTANTNAYAGGTAYSTGVAADGYGYGLGDTSLTPRAGDRVFVVALTAAVSPLPPRFNIQPTSLSVYGGRTAQFTAKASGTPTLVYQWRKNGLNVSNGGNISGATTDTLKIANISAADAASYTLVVTNSASSGNIITSAPATLTVIAAPAAGSFGDAVLTNNPVAFWRLDEIADPSTNPPAYEYVGGFVGTYEVGSSNGFNGIVGPRPSAFPGFASTNSAAAITAGLGTTPTWVTLAPLLLNTNRVTMTAWIYPNGDQAEYCGLFEVGSGRAGLAYGGDFSHNAGELIYWWQGATYTFKSGLLIPPNQWSFIAVVVEPTKATLYLGSNGVLNAAVDFSPHPNELFGAKAELGHQPGRGDRVYNGSIDDAAVFNYPLSFDQINVLYGTGLGSIQTRPPAIVKQPLSTALYAGQTARFEAATIGSSPLSYQWKKNGGNVSNGGNISGALTDSLSIGNVSAGDAAVYTLVVTNSASSGNTVTSAPASLIVVSAPTPGTYAYTVLSRNPVAHWRLDEVGNPATNAPAYDYVGGLLGRYEIGSSNGFNGIVGPRPSAFPGFAANNNSVQTTGTGDGLTPTWVTLPPMNLSTNTVTLTAWIHPNDIQLPYAGLLVSSSGAGFAYGGDFSGNAGQLIYWWNFGTTYTFVSGLTIPANQWSFVAVVIEPTKATLYLGTSNTLSTAVNSIAHTSDSWGAGTAQLGGQGSSPDNRIFNGSIDEVAVFNYAFTPAEVLSLFQAGTSVTLNIEKVGSNVRLTWPQGTLLEATSVTGPWNTNLNVSPYTFAPSEAKKFFRVKLQ
jgi:Concanavalin A-like lectin/glucanases superfamily/Immunoglobulin I-set domain